MYIAPLPVSGRGRGRGPGRNQQKLRKNYLKDGGRESLTFDLKPAFGELTIHTTPENAQVYLNNASIGRSPIAGRRVKSGSYSIRVERELYHSEEQRVDIKDGDHRELTLTLDPAFGELVINSEPEKGATVFMDGIEVGKTPYQYLTMSNFVL